MKKHASRPLVAATLLAATASMAFAQAPVVNTQSGAVEGSTADSIESFKGIPFAAPPTGSLRWRPPEPHQPWTGVRPALDYGHDCMQKPLASDYAPLGTTPSEDCLVLNVWRPAGKMGKLPVLVWIYGGGFVNGGSSPAVYSGEAFAKHGLMFVSFNYRLGRLGFFAHPALSEEQQGEPLGNYGYMDQLAALRWIKANIAAFGGDPSQVTVLGESAGGESVNVWLTSPMSKSLFERAIIQSGGGREHLTGSRRVAEDLPGLPSGETLGLAFARSRGITGTGAAALAQLRALPAASIADFDLMSLFAPGGPPNYAGPMQDGRIVVESPQAAYLAGREAKVAVMVGADTADLAPAPAQTMAELFSSFGDDAAKAQGIYDPGHTGDVQAADALVGMDRLMVEPARFVASTFASQGLPAYEFRFGYVAQSARGQFPNGTGHATEIPFVFDTVQTKYGSAATPQDEAVARAANTYWSNFARTGDPNGPGLPLWPRYSSAEDRLMLFAADGHPSAVIDPCKSRLDLTAAHPATP